ncbi:TaqI-like C-terminal specificity domain-containing protein [Chlorobium sp. KB01]|uniref:TaqI-like C-terminal specificity domain-containing protein n=1 Tax=Chlorobium sp. KB01 TaxID=1917528 RepID=UPI000977883C|nr:TaqI-like C-terminal specificity domain-containing protein [Chlorobium sp. KB01]
MGLQLLTIGYENDIARQLATWDPYDQNSSSPFFDMEWMFGIEDGFDVVIGNPPYTQLSKIDGVPDWYKDYLKKTYQTSGGRLNTFIFFIHLGFNILREKGVLTYIIPNTILTQEYYKATRDLLLRKNSLRALVQYTGLPFDNAIVENVTLIACKEYLKEYKIKIMTDDLFVTTVKEIVYNTKFLINDDLAINILSDNIVDKSYLVSKYTIGDLCYINQGIALKGDRRLSLHDSNKNGQFVKKLDGRNIERYMIRWDGTYLDWDLTKIHSCKSRDIFLSKEKLFFRRVSENLIFTYDTEQYYALNTLVVVNLKEDKSINLKCLLALLNSRLMNYIYKRKFKSTKTVFSEIQTNTIKKLPIPNISHDVEKALTILVDYILNAKHKYPETDISEYEKKIDSLVYLLYELAPEEISIVEKQP